MAVPKPGNGSYRQTFCLTLSVLLLVISAHGTAGSKEAFWVGLDRACGSDSRADKKDFFQQYLRPDREEKHHGSAIGSGLLALEAFQANHPTHAHQERMEAWFGVRLLALLCQERELATRSGSKTRQLRGVWQGENESQRLVELYSVSEAASIALFSEFSRAIATLAKEGGGLTLILNRELAEEPALHKQVARSTAIPNKRVKPVPTQLESCKRMLNARQYLISPSPGKSAFSCLRSAPPPPWGG